MTPKARVDQKEQSSLIRRCFGNFTIKLSKQKEKGEKKLVLEKCRLNK